MLEIIKISLIAFMFVAISQQEQSIFSWYQKLINPLPWYIREPIGGCAQCFTGQVCLWYYVLTVRPFAFVDFLFYPAAGIFLSLIYNRIYKWLYYEGSII